METNEDKILFLENRIIEHIDIIKEDLYRYRVDLDIKIESNDGSFIYMNLDIPFDRLMYRIYCFSELKEEFKKQTINGIIQYLKEECI
jgi:hypothetical protein